jgi:hypothetical protein
LAAPIAPDHHQLISQVERSNECEEDTKDQRKQNYCMLTKVPSLTMRVLYLFALFK